MKTKIFLKICLLKTRKMSKLVEIIKIAEISNKKNHFFRE